MKQVKQVKYYQHSPLISQWHGWRVQFFGHEINTIQSCPRTPSFVNLTSI